MYSKEATTLFLIFLITLDLSNGANILFYLQIGSYSHRLAVWPLVEKLASNGHKVTFSHPFQPLNPNPNVTEFTPVYVEDLWKKDGFNVLTLKLNGGWYETKKTNIELYKFGLDGCEKFLSQPNAIDWINRSKFDIVFIDALYNECAYGMAHKWGAKTILYFTSHPTGIWGTEALGFLDTGEESWISDMVFVQETPMNSFWRRCLSITTATAFHLLKEWYYYPSLTQLLREKLEMPNMPTVNQLVRNTDLAFYNSHFSEELARSLPPMFVSVSALHAWGKKAEPLPKDFMDFLKSSKHEGFIYVSFGSEADLATVSEELQNVFFDAFGESTINFVWKWTGERHKKMKENIYTAKWLPQFDILASPLCRGFIGHGGLLGIQEAVLNGVPMITFPIFAEQGYNGQRIQNTGRGINLDITTITTQKLKEAINNILTNENYKNNMTKASKMLKDQLKSPLETAIYWTEYVLRNDDLTTLKPLKSIQNYWFQNYLLDVWAFFTVILIITFLLLKKLIKLYCNASKHFKKSKQKIN